MVLASFLFTVELHFELQGFNEDEAVLVLDTSPDRGGETWSTVIWCVLVIKSPLSWCVWVKLVVTARPDVAPALRRAPVHMYVYTRSCHH